MLALAELVLVLLSILITAVPLYGLCVSSLTQLVVHVVVWSAHQLVQFFLRANHPKRGNTFATFAYSLTACISMTLVMTLSGLFFLLAVPAIWTVFSVLCLTRGCLRLGKPREKTEKALRFRFTPTKLWLVLILALASPASAAQYNVPEWVTETWSWTQTALSAAGTVATALTAYKALRRQLEHTPTPSGELTAALAAVKQLEKALEEARVMAEERIDYIDKSSFPSVLHPLDSTTTASMIRRWQMIVDGIAKRAGAGLDYDKVSKKKAAEFVDEMIAAFRSANSSAPSTDSTLAWLPAWATQEWFASLPGAPRTTPPHIIDGATIQLTAPTAPTEKEMGVRLPKASDLPAFRTEKGYIDWRIAMTRFVLSYEVPQIHLQTLFNRILSALSEGPAAAFVTAYDLNVLLESPAGKNLSSALTAFLKRMDNFFLPPNTLDELVRVFRNVRPKGKKALDFFLEFETAAQKVNTVAKILDIEGNNVNLAELKRQLLAVIGRPTRDALIQHFGTFDEHTYEEIKNAAIPRWQDFSIGGTSTSGKKEVKKNVGESARATAQDVNVRIPLVSMPLFRRNLLAVEMKIRCRECGNPHFEIDCDALPQSERSSRRSRESRSFTPPTAEQEKRSEKAAREEKERMDAAFKGKKAAYKEIPPTPGPSQRPGIPMPPAHHEFKGLTRGWGTPTPAPEKKTTRSGRVVKPTAKAQEVESEDEEGYGFSDEEGRVASVAGGVQLTLEQMGFRGPV